MLSSNTCVRSSRLCSPPGREMAFGVGRSRSPGRAGREDEGRDAAGAAAAAVRVRRRRDTEAAGMWPEVMADSISEAEPCRGSVPDSVCRSACCRLCLQTTPPHSCSAIRGLQYEKKRGVIGSATWGLFAHEV